VSPVDLTWVNQSLSGVTNLAKIAAPEHRMARIDCVGNRIRAVLAATVLSAAFAGAAVPANAASPQQGKRLALLYCSKCHSIDKVSPSPLSIAPPFRTLHERYPIDTLQEALAEGIITGHPSMPEFRFEGDQIDDLLAYLKTLEQPAR
jgi:mono/diheme cytochrome c family protein